MTDGPFKNLRLGSCWKRLAEAVQNDAASPDECSAVASDALTRHLINKEHVRALQEIEAHLGQRQLELDPLGSIEAIFDRCEKTPFLDALQKELAYRTANDMALSDAIVSALDAAIASQISETRNRFHEEYIRAQEDGEMSRDAAETARGKVDAAFDAVDCERVREALIEGRQDAFENDVGKSDGVDDGMVRL
ncbi:MAG: hypothetical protein GC150_07380 [Rhizobiales bacterium]|nr:hypothetical protein [Hyphomicrobiales bacterium]